MAKRAKTSSATVLRQPTDHPHPAVAKILDGLAGMSGSRIPRGKLPACWACGSKLDVMRPEPGRHRVECKSCTWWAVGITDAGPADDGNGRKFDVMFSQTFYGVVARTDSPAAAVAPEKGRKERVKKDAAGGDRQK